MGEEIIQSGIGGGRQAYFLKLGEEEDNLKRWNIASKVELKVAEILEQTIGVSFWPETDAYCAETDAYCIYKRCK